VEGPVLVIHQSNEQLDKMDAWNKGTHGKSGLVDKVKASTLDEDVAQEQLIAFLSQYVPKGGSPMCGNSIDLMVSSQTGSGKTAAFLLPVLHTLLAMQADEDRAEKEAFEAACADALAKGEVAPKRPKRKDPTNPRNFKPAEPGALVVCPTRELAQQVANDGIDLVRHCRGLRIANVVGGMPYQLQVAKLQNANLVVATPGRLLDLQRAGQLKLDKVMFLVMDEADRMLDFGFADDLAEINQLTAQRHQTMMFSATFAPRIQQLAMRVMHDNGANVKKIQIDSPRKSTPTSRKACTGPTRLTTSASCSTTGCVTRPSTRPSCLPAPRSSATTWPTTCNRPTSRLWHCTVP
jgi:hypothetical protein